MAVKAPLKYLFHVQYYDGGGFIQNKEDISKVDPLRSAFYDVEQDKVQYFQLIDPGKDETILALNLAEGSFFDLTKTFYVGDPGPKPYKLMFHRQHTHGFNLGLDEISHEIKYCIGYTDATGVEHKVYVN